MTPGAGARWLQSYSGVRATLGRGPDVTPVDETFAYRHAYCYALSRLQAHPATTTRLVLARDPRPTGAALAAAQARGLSAACRQLGVMLEIIYLDVVTTPLWQHAVRHFEADGGVMITASHNPLDDNGWKYATGVRTFAVDPAPPGALLSAPEMANLIRAAGAFAPPVEAPVLRLEADAASRDRVFEAYVDFVARTYRAATPGARVVLDPNGGAASVFCGVVFRALGVEPVLVNARLGVPAHEIDVEQRRPDGRHVLDALAARVAQERALFGLAFDFDADRGSLTYVDAAGAACVPSPQAAAAINAAVALAIHRRSRDPRPAVVVASDATSCRVKQIAAAFGAEVVEVETGEINVVSAMQEIDARGRCAVVGVEGPNGGTIFAGTTCRDGALVGAGALLAAADRDLRRIIADALAPGRVLAEGLAGVMGILPAQHSVMATGQTPREWTDTVGALTAAVGAIFARECAGRWARWDVVYSHTRYSGPDRPLAAGYGWKARLFREGRSIEDAFVWVRGSKTEAGVVRIIADAPDLDTAERLLKATSGIVF